MPGGHDRFTFVHCMVAFVFVQLYPAGQVAHGDKEEVEERSDGTDE